MAGQDERPSNGVCDCSCKCHDTVCDKVDLSTGFLRSINHPNLVWHPSHKIKWEFVSDEGDERQVAN